MRRNEMGSNLFVIKQCLYNLSLLTTEKIICYLVIITGFFGSALLAVDVGHFHVFAFRFFLVLLWVMIGARILLAGNISIPKGKIRWYLLFLGFWLVYAIFSLAWAISFADAIKNILFLFSGISLVFFICYYFRKKEELKSLYYLFFGFFILLLVIGIVEYLTGCHLPISRYYDSVKVFIPTSVFCNENDFATFLALYIPFGICMFYYGRKKILKLIGIVSILCACYLIVIIGSRSSMLAVFLEFVILFFLLTNLKQKLYLIVVIVSSFFILNIVDQALMINVFSMMIEQVKSLAMQYELKIGSVDVRWNLIRNGVLFLISTMGFGVGAGNIEYWMSNFGQYNTAGIINMHNWWMEIMTAYGILVFIGYVLFFFGILYNLAKVRLRFFSRHDRMLCDTLILSLSGFIIACVGPSSFINLNMQWFLFGIALAYLNSVIPAKMNNNYGTKYREG